MAYLCNAAARLAEGFPEGSLTAVIAAMAHDRSGDGSRDDVFDGALCAAAMAVGKDAEAADAFALATLILDFARVLVGLSEFRLQGRLLGQQARIFRKIGEHETALELYDEVTDIGNTHGDQELIALAHLGKGSVARVRGNLPRAREEFSAVLNATVTGDEVRELHMHAHHGLLIVSARVNDFDAALMHGSLALELAQTADSRNEMLVNLSSVCYDTGQFRAALHGYLRALREGGAQRVRITALGGATLAAARLGERAMVNTLATAAAPLLIRHGHEYELADMARELAEAYWYLGETALASRYRDCSMERAQRGGFFGIVDLLESFHASSQPDRPCEIALADDALTVAKQLASGDSEELLLAAVGGGQQWPPGTV